MTETKIRINVTVPAGLPQRAKRAGLNVSATCAKGLEKAVEKLEEPNEARVNAAKAERPDYYPRRSST